MGRAQHRGWRAAFLGLLISAALLGGCAPQAGRSDGASEATPTGSAPRTLVMAFRYEAADLSSKIPDPVATSEKPLFNAGLTGADDHGVRQPFLAEVTPRLNTETWRVAVDGQMETTYRLRPGLTWHDGQPLTAEDFAFAWRVYTDPGLGIFRPKPQDLIVDAAAAGPLTVVFRWRAPFADADVLDQEDLPPLPRHILGGPYAEYQQDPGNRDRFIGHRFWTEGYVGAGPYRLERWEPGTALHAEAFSGYVFGRPKIDRIIARVFSDENAVLANVLSGEVDITYNNALRFEHALVLKREWTKGTVALAPAAASVVYPQFRPEYQKTPALFDLRVRKALMHSIDKEALREGLFGGLGTIAHTTVSPDESFFPALDRVITKYDYDARKAEAFMNEAGFFKDASGFFVDGSGQRFRPDFHVLSGLTFEQQGAIMYETWQRAGIDTNYYVMPTAQSREAINRHTFSGLGNGRPNTFSADQIGTAENKWAGSNRGGWYSPEYEALYTTFNNTLDRAERDRLQMEMYKLVSEQLATFMLYFDIKQIAYINELAGVVATNPFWTMHMWELRSP